MEVWERFVIFVKEHGEEKFFEWVLIGVFVAGAVYLVRVCLQRLGGFLDSRKHMKVFEGRYFLYHAPTSEGFSSTPRITTLDIGYNSFGVPRAVQENIRPARKMHIGAPTASYSLLAILFAPRDNAFRPSKDARYKMISMLPFQWSAVLNAHVSIGVMAGANQTGEPWRVSFLISERMLPTETVSLALGRIETNVLSNRMRAQVIEELERASEKQAPCVFNCPWGSDEAFAADTTP